MIKTSTKLFYLIALFIVIGCSKNDLESQSMPKVGDIAPVFTLPNDQGGETALGDFRGKKRVVLYFYPKDDTPECTREALDFSRNLSKFDSLEAEILGISVDSIASHKIFREKFGIDFSLLSDVTKRVSRNYGVLNEMGYDNRTTFIIDKQGIITAIFENVEVDGHAEQVLSALKQ